MKEENQRIARNTLIVYMRLIVTTLLGLVSLRYVMSALGASDYGLYNVVGATVIMFSFITSALYNTTTRFINFEQGKRDGDVGKIFNMSVAIHVVFALVALALLESVGVYYILHYLHVEPGKEADAMFAFQVSAITVSLSLVCVPFNSMFIVHEDFRTIAVIDILGAVAKFGLILMLLCHDGNLLRFYAVSMALVTALMSLAYLVLSRRKWPEETRLRIVRGRQKYKEILAYNNWSLLSAAALIFRNQGSNMVINYFFGTIVNAAYAISFSVQNYITTFVGNFDIASAPQITQSYSRGDIERTVFLSSSTCRICILLTLLLLLPIYAELPFILHLWLGKALPDGTVTFCQCSMLVALVSATSGGITQLIRGTGRLKWFTLQFVLLYALALLVSIGLYVLGFPPYTVILAYFLADGISRVIQLILLRKYIGFDLKSFAERSYLRPLGVLALGAAYVLVAEKIVPDEAHWLYHIANLLAAFAFTAVLAYCIGLYKEEQAAILSHLKRYLPNKNNTE